MLKENLWKNHLLKKKKLSKIFICNIFKIAIFKVFQIVKGTLPKNLRSLAKKTEGEDKYLVIF